MKTTDIFPDAPCVGYYRMSDETDPRVIGDTDGYGQRPEPLPETLREVLENPERNPFAVEAQLFFPARRLSVGIRYVDGAYVISRKETAEDPKAVAAGRHDNITLKRYVAHRMPGKRLLFLQYWKETPDPLCAGMPVLQPAETAFIGFEPLKPTEGK